MWISFYQNLRLDIQLLDLGSLNLYLNGRKTAKEGISEASFVPGGFRKGSKVF